MPSISNNKESSQERPEVRCYCGQLLAKLVERGLEIKCRRCKHVRLIEWPDIKQPKTS